MAKRLVFLSAGHSNGQGISNDRGAKVRGFDIWEGDLAILLRDKIAYNLISEGISVTEDRDTDALAQTFTFFKNLVNTNSINVDIHFNAAASSVATGTECFIKSIDPRFGWQIQVANRFCSAVASVLNIPNRGVKGERQSARGRLGWMNLTGHNFLIEICFLSNSYDVSKFFACIDDVADALSKEIKNAAEQ
jgi:N-acetylmuramoyl-L-alanine amidase